MYRKIRNVQCHKHHNAKNGKGGFTLAELCVVLALLATLTTMVLSFSLLMNDYVADNNAAYQFLEDCSALKNQLTRWSAQNDTADHVFALQTDGTLSLKVNQTEQNLRFEEGVLYLGTTQMGNFDTIQGVSFSTNGTLIKCVMYRDHRGERMESSFVFSLRCGVIQIREVTENA